MRVPPSGGPAPWLVLTHAAWEGPGALAGRLDLAGVPWTLCRTEAGDCVPGPESAPSWGGVVAMGGPMGVADTAEHPWLAPERALLRAAVEAGCVVLGVCLGAQQLAAALGGVVSPAPQAEIGPGTVDLTAQGAADPVLGPAGSPLACVHWHADTFSLPPGAVHLASNRSTDHQAFRIGTRAYGLQFHVEVDPVLMAGWEPRLAPDARVDPSWMARVGASGQGILDRLVALATS